MQQAKNKDAFPLYLFLTYVIYYCGQSVFNTYHSVFLSQRGFSESAIGTIGSVATIILLVIQPVWGMITDRSRHKNVIAGVILACAGLSGLAIYLSDELWWLAICAGAISIFSPIATTLQDNCTLQHTEGTKWDFGNIRLGGTIGYAGFAAFMGFLIKEYSVIYFWIAFFYVMAGVMLMFLRSKNPVAAANAKEKQKHNYKLILQNKALICLLVFNLLYSVANTFSRYFSIYYTEELGATSQMLSIATMVSCTLELPICWFAGKIHRKLGIRNTLTLAALTAIIKNVLFATITNSWAMIGAYVISGCSFPLFNFCILNYINESVPQNMRATSQSFNSILVSVISGIIFGPVVGLITEAVGCRITIVIGAVIMTVGTIAFRIVFKRVSNESTVTV